VSTPPTSKPVKDSDYHFDATKVPPPDVSSTAFSLRIEPSWGYRRFLDREPSSSNKRSGTRGVFLIGGSAELYPFAGAQSGIWRDIGLTGSVFRSVGLTMTDFDTNESVDAIWYGYSAGLRARLLGRHSSFALGLSAGYESWVFAFVTNIEPVRIIPTARYGLFEGGLDARESIGSLAFLAEASFLYPSTVADLGNRTPLQGGYGGRGVLGLAVMLSRALEIDALATYTAVRFSLASVPGRADEPGEVLDQYLVSTLGLKLSL
jgi:hypothetical protein